MHHVLQIVDIPVKPRLAGLVATILATLALWRFRNRTRRQLGALDARTLADLGLSPAQQGAEAGKWFWQP